MAMKITYATDFHEAMMGSLEGDPINCDFGSRGSAVGPLIMTCRGAYGGLEGVAIRAYSEHLTIEPRMELIVAASQS